MKRSSRPVPPRRSRPRVPRCEPRRGSCAAESRAPLCSPLLGAVRGFLPVSRQILALFDRIPIIGHKTIGGRPACPTYPLKLAAWVEVSVRRVVIHLPRAFNS